MTVLIGTLAVMAVPSLSGFTSSRNNVTALRIWTAVTYAQEWAIGTSNDTWVAFDTANDLVSVYVEDPDNPGKAGRIAMTDPLTRAAMTLDLGQDGSGIAAVDMGGTDEVQFDSLGVPYDGDGDALSADGTIEVAGGLTVRVTRNTGLVTID